MPSAKSSDGRGLLSLQSRGGLSDGGLGSLLAGIHFFFVSSTTAAVNRPPMTPNTASAMRAIMRMGISASEDDCEAARYTPPVIAVTTLRDC